MKVRRILIAMAGCVLISFALSVGSAQAGGPKAKDYTYCVFAPGESECFKGPFEVFHKTHSWHWEEVGGTYTIAPVKQYDFHEANGPDELIGTKGSHGVISGRLYENGAPTEYTFTLTPVKKG